MKKRRGKFLDNDRKRAVEMVKSALGDYSSRWAAIKSVSRLIGCSPNTLLDWVHRDDAACREQDAGGISDRERVKALEGEIRELRRINEILRLASACLFSARSTAA